jgi:hypothetical protein
MTVAATTGPDEHGGEGATTPPRRRRRRAVGPAGVPSAAPDAASDWSLAPDPPEDGDERLLREVPPHHGG